MEERLPMNAADAAWLHMDRPTNLMVINSVMWFDEPVDWDRVEDVIRERLVDAYPTFAMSVVESHIPGRTPHWEVDRDFDLDTHVHHIALPPPGDRAALQELVANLMVRPLDRSHPLWEMYEIDGYGDGAAVFTRMHHCIADGIALARVLLSLTDATPDAGIAPPRPKAAESSSLAARVTGPAAAGMRLVQELLDPSRLRELPADAKALAKILLTPPDKNEVFKGTLHVADKVTWSDPIPLATVKEVGHATGSTVNDVLVTAMTGALRDYLRSRDGLVESIRAFVPFNLRPLGEPLPRELGNRFGLVYLDLPVGMRTAKARLQEVKRLMSDIKSSQQGPVAYGILGLLGHTPELAERYAIDMFSSRGSCVLTNVPGPREHVYMAGTPVRGALAWAPTSGSVGMSISIFSYAGEVTVGLLVDANLVPDPDRVIKSFHAELPKLERLAHKPAPKKEVATR